MKAIQTYNRMLVGIRLAVARRSRLPEHPGARSTPAEGPSCEDRARVYDFRADIPCQQHGGSLLRDLSSLVRADLGGPHPACASDGWPGPSAQQSFQCSVVLAAAHLVRGQGA